jgi:hypothetical protein
VSSWFDRLMFSPRYCRTWFYITAAFLALALALFMFFAGRHDFKRAAVQYVCVIADAWCCSYWYNRGSKLRALEELLNARLMGLGVY